VERRFYEYRGMRGGEHYERMEANPMIGYRGCFRNVAESDLFGRWKNTRRAMAYSRVTREERNHIHRWRQEGCGVREIAALLSRAASSISRELSRNTGLRGYRPKQAHRLAQERALRPGPRRFTDEVRLDAEARIREGWTPEIISGRARLEGRPWVCKETLYKHVYADARQGGDLWTHLPRSRRKRRRRCPRQEGRGRGRIPNQGSYPLYD